MRESRPEYRATALEGIDVRETRAHNHPARSNAAPSDLLVTRRNHETGIVSLGPLRWGLPHCQDPTGGRRADQRQIRDGVDPRAYPAGRFCCITTGARSVLISKWNRDNANKKWG